MARSILAVLIGYLTFGVSAGVLFGLSGRDPHVVPGAGFLVFAILYGVGFALLGGYLAAAIAGRRPLVHAGIVAGIIGALALVSLLAQMRSGSVWTELSVLAFMVPAALLGGRLRRRG